MPIAWGALQAIWPDVCVAVVETQTRKMVADPECSIPKGVVCEFPARTLASGGEVRSRWKEVLAAEGWHKAQYIIHLISLPNYARRWASRKLS